MEKSKKPSNPMESLFERNCEPYLRTSNSIKFRRIFVSNQTFHSYEMLHNYSWVASNIYHSTSDYAKDMMDMLQVFPIFQQQFRVRATEHTVETTTL
jgi:vacuolar-type H+-ATPase catalytic subunit A/Vma1